MAFLVRPSSLNAIIVIDFVHTKYLLAYLPAYPVYGAAAGHLHEWPGGGIGRDADERPGKGRASAASMTNRGAVAAPGDKMFHGLQG